MNDLFEKFFAEYLTKLNQALGGLDCETIKAATVLISRCKGTVWLIGNGGSASLASHMATDLQLAGVRAIALTDVAAITTYANDMRYVDVFTQQLQRLAQPGDIVLAMSGSGNSFNVGHSLCYARDHSLTSILITGYKGGRMGQMFQSNWVDAQRFRGLHINVPAPHMGLAQDGHQVVLHMISYFLMEHKNGA